MTNESHCGVIITQITVTCLKTTTEILDGVKYVQS